MTDWIGPIVFATFAWWFATGAILYLDRRPTSTFKWSMLGATVLMAVGYWGLWQSAQDASVPGAYLAFASALAVWAWHEISFYMGYVTGPRRHACAEGCAGSRHIGHAVAVSLWHELAIVVSFVLIAALTWGTPNQVGLWTFVILWGMHESARLNVVLGVRNVSAHFLPPHLAYLKSFLTVKPMNLLFPVSITGSTVIGVLLVAAAAGATDGFERTGLTFLATMTILAILEHWFLILPINAEAMWNWSLASRDRPTAAGAPEARAHAPHLYPHHPTGPAARLRPAHR